MEKKTILLSLLLVSILLISGGCANTTQKTSDSQGVIEKVTEKIIPTVASKQPSEMLLEVEDFPEGYSQKSKAPRLKSEVSKWGQNAGWIDGYAISFIKGESMIDFVVVSQLISIYPLENISKTLRDKESNENFKYEEMPNPNIGKKSNAYKITESNEWGSSNFYYEIVFYKINVYETLTIQGTSMDYEVLIEMARKAEAKIK